MESRNQCYYCDQLCENANALRRHCKQAHGKDRCHVCGVCKKAFKRATHLKVRPATHNRLLTIERVFHLTQRRGRSVEELFWLKISLLMTKHWAQVAFYFHRPFLCGESADGDVRVEGGGRSLKFKPFPSHVSLLLRKGHRATGFSFCLL